MYLLAATQHLGCLHWVVVCRFGREKARFVLPLLTHFLVEFIGMTEFLFLKVSGRKKPPDKDIRYICSHLFYLQISLLAFSRTNLTVIGLLAFILEIRLFCLL